MEWSGVFGSNTGDGEPAHGDRFGDDLHHILDWHSAIVVSTDHSALCMHIKSFKT